jgi:hypothetical protein
MPSTFRIPKATITGLYGKALTTYERGRFNSAAGLQARGFSDGCEVPMRVRAVVVARPDSPGSTLARNTHTTGEHVVVAGPAIDWLAAAAG